MAMPFLTEARAPLTREIEAVNEYGDTQAISIPAERPLTVYVDKRELVTLMTLGARPEWLVLGYLRNQRLVRSLDEVESVTVDWEVGAAAVKTRSGIDEIEARTARRVVTTGCGQGSVFGGLMDEIDSVRLPEAAITRLATRRFTSCSNGPGSVSSKSLASKTSRRSGEPYRPKFDTWASPHICTVRPAWGADERSAAMMRAAPR